MYFISSFLLIRKGSRVLPLAMRYASLTEPKNDDHSLRLQAKGISIQSKIQSVSNHFRPRFFSKVG